MLYWGWLWSWYSIGHECLNWIRLLLVYNETALYVGIEYSRPVRIYFSALENILEIVLGRENARDWLRNLWDARLHALRQGFLKILELASKISVFWLAFPQAKHSTNGSSNSNLKSPKEYLTIPAATSSSSLKHHQHCY